MDVRSDWLGGGIDRIFSPPHASFPQLMFREHNQPVSRMIPPVWVGNGGGDGSVHVLIAVPGRHSSNNRTELTDYANPKCPLILSIAR